MAESWVPCADVTPAAWFSAGLGRFGTPAGIVPAGFDAYVRVLHPVGPDGVDPDEGNLPPDELGALCRLLADFTCTPDRCWLTVWEGWGCLPAAWPRDYPRIHQPHRAYYLFESRLTDVVAFATGAGPSVTGITWAQSPSQWWPADRQWCVATEIDLDYTLVGGSQALADALLAEPALTVAAIPDLARADHTVDPAP